MSSPQSGNWIQDGCQEHYPVLPKRRKLDIANNCNSPPFLRRQLAAHQNNYRIP